MSVIKMNSLLIFLILCLIGSYFCENTNRNEFISTEITRTYYLTKRVVKVAIEVKIRSIRDEIKDFLYEFTLSPEYFSNVGFISAGSSTININNYKINSIDSENIFQIEIGDISERERVFYIEYHLGNPFKPLPKTIRLGENQLVEFEDEIKLKNNYKVIKEKIIIKFLTGTIIERFLPKNMRRHDNKLSHIVDIDEKSTKFYVHFSLNNHLVYYDSISRIIEISHWGNLKIREEYSGINEAALNKGEFHRKEIMILSGQGFARMRTPGTVLPQNTHVCFFFDHILPYRAEGLEYYDQIGNISYSNAWRAGNTHTILQTQPRSPLMGGWKFDYIIEYNLPLETAVFYDSNLKIYMLNLTVMPSAKGIYSKNITTEIRFPTGSSDISIDFPINNNLPSLKREPNLSYYFGWLDIFKPRPVLIYNVNSSYIPEQMLLNYKFQTYYKIKSHFLTFSGTFLISFLCLIPFIVVVVIRRFKSSEKIKKD